MNFLLRPLLAISIFAASSLQAADPITLKKQWLVGKHYEQTMDLDQGTSTTIGGMKMDQKMQMTMVMDETVSKAKSGPGKLLIIKYERLLMNMDVNGQKMSMDSTKKDEKSPFGDALSGMIGKDVRVDLDANDEVSGIENFDELMQGLGGAANPILSAMFNKDSLANAIKQGSLMGFPGKPVKPGDSWTFDAPMPLAQVGKGSLKGTYTYKGTSVHDGVPCAEIAMDAKIDLDLSGLGAAAGGNANPLSNLGIAIKDSSMKGTIWFDNALGTARDSELHQEMTMTMNNPGKPDEKMTIPTTQTIRNKLTKVEDAK